MARKPESYGTMHGIGLGWFICKLGLERFLHRSSRHVVFVTSRPVLGERVSRATEKAVHFSLDVEQGTNDLEVRTKNRCPNCTLHRAIDCVVPTHPEPRRLPNAWRFKKESATRRSRHD